MSEIEKIQRYIRNSESGNFPYNTRYQMKFPELVELSHLESAEAICLAFDYGRAKGFRAAKSKEVAK